MDHGDGVLLLPGPSVTCTRTRTQLHDHWRLLSSLRTWGYRLCDVSSLPQSDLQDGTTSHSLQISATVPA